MRRREFLQRTAGGAVAWQLALWSSACGQAHAQEGEAPAGGPPPPWTPAAELERLRASAELARASKRPLLLLILPDTQGLRTEHGEAWGELVLHGSARTVAALATCELACARLAAVRAVCADLVDVPLEPCIAMVLELEARTVRTVQLDLGFEPRPHVSLAGDVAVRERITKLSAALEAALAPDAATLDVRLRRAAEERGVNLAPGEALVETLAKLERVHLGVIPPSGAAWATQGICGVRVEHPMARNVGSPCGMAHVPELSERFLFYLVDLEYQ